MTLSEEMIRDLHTIFTIANKVSAYRKNMAAMDQAAKTMKENRKQYNNAFEEAADFLRMTENNRRGR
ncbi:MAG: hypothetical protein IJJ29_07430 [Solobacterium sp.]|nr:hypothetical protein [Solobacterium sp.]